MVNFFIVLVFPAGGAAAIEFWYEWFDATMSGSIQSNNLKRNGLTV